MSSHTPVQTAKSHTLLGFRNISSIRKGCPRLSLLLLLLYLTETEGLLVRRKFFGNAEILSRESCLSTKGHLFNDHVNKCFLAVGSQCSIMDLDNVWVQNGLNCTSNAQCFKGKCECKPGFGVTDNNTCLFDYGRTCAADFECNAAKGLVCRNSACVCEATGHYVHLGGSDGKCFNNSELLLRFVQRFESLLIDVIAEERFHARYRNSFRVMRTRHNRKSHGHL